MTVLMILVMGGMLVAAVLVGVVVMHKGKGKPSAGTDADGDPRKSS